MEPSRSTCVSMHSWTPRRLSWIWDVVARLDVDASASSNPYLDEFRLIESETLPLDDDSVDLIVCDNVLEHIEDPDALFREIRRVLRHGGFLCIRTPNRWGYIAVISRLVPHRFHSRLISTAQHGRRENDVFPAFYRCNSARILRRTMRANGFDVVVSGYEAEPRYLEFSAWAYFFGVLFQRFAPHAVRNALLAFARLDKSSS
jgi:SAM-dependent methyltransferase